jgi:hypothetical protein
LITERPRHSNNQAIKSSNLGLETLEWLGFLLAAGLVEPAFAVDASDARGTAAPRVLEHLGNAGRSGMFVVPSRTLRLLHEYTAYPYSAHHHGRDTASQWNDMEMYSPVIIDERF